MEVESAQTNIVHAELVENSFSGASYLQWLNEMESCTVTAKHDGLDESELLLFLRKRSPRSKTKTCIYVVNVSEEHRGLFLRCGYDQNILQKFRYS